MGLSAVELAAPVAAASVACTLTLRSDSESLLRSASTSDWALAPLAASAADGLMMGLGFTGALVVIGAVREIIGSGTLFAQASLLLGQGMAFLELTVIPHYRGFLLAILPPGGFLALGFILAGKRLLDRRLAEGRKAAAPREAMA